MLQRFCERLAQDWEIEEGFETDIPGVWIIPLGEDLEVVLTEIDGGYTMSAALAQAPKNNREDFFTTLMTANVLGQGTRGAVLSIDDNDIVTLSLTMLGVSQQREFQERLEDFVQMVSQWKSVTDSAAKVV